MPVYWPPACLHFLIYGQYCRDIKADELKELISAFADQVVIGPFRRIVVSRSNVWRSASQFWRLPIVANRSGLILCKFQGDDNVLEPSIDHGEPR